MELLKKVTVGILSTILLAGLFVYLHHIYDFKLDDLSTVFQSFALLKLGKHGSRDIKHETLYTDSFEIPPPWPLTGFKIDQVVLRTDAGELLPHFQLTGSFDPKGPFPDPNPEPSAFPDAHGKTQSSGPDQTLNRPKPKLEMETHLEIGEEPNPPDETQEVLNLKELPETVVEINIKVGTDVKNPPVVLPNLEPFPSAEMKMWNDDLKAPNQTPNPNMPNLDPVIRRAGSLTIDKIHGDLIQHPEEEAEILDAFYWVQSDDGIISKKEAFVSYKVWTFNEPSCVKRHFFESSELYVHALPSTSPPTQPSTQQDQMSVKLFGESIRVGPVAEFRECERERRKSILTFLPNEGTPEPKPSWIRKLWEAVFPRKEKYNCTFRKQGFAADKNSQHTLVSLLFCN